MWQYDPNLRSWDPINLYDTSLRPQSSDDESVHDLIFDATGLLWVSSWGQGLYKQRAQKEFYSYTFNPSNNNRSLSYPEVSAIEPSTLWENLLWVGTYGGGLNILDKDTGRFLVVRANQNDAFSLSNDKVFALEESSTGLLWVGTGSGLDYIELDKEEANPLSQQLRIRKGLSNLYVHSIEESQLGGIWVGGEEGLLKLNLDSVGISNYTPNSIEEKLNYFSVWPLLESEFQERLWIGTYGGGVRNLDLSMDSGQIALNNELDALLQEYKYILTIQEDQTENVG